MDNRINFAARSNNYFAITKKGWQSAIPDAAYSQIDANRSRLEKFARKNNIKITFTDGNNMLPEFHTGRESMYLSNRLAMEVEKKPSLTTKIKTAFSNLGDKIAHKDNTPKLTVSTVSYFEKDSKNLPSLKEKEKVGLFLEYEPTEKPMDRRIDFNSVVEFLQNVVGKKIK